MSVSPKADFELGERTEGEAEAEGLPSRQASISPRWGLGIRVLSDWAVGIAVGID